MLHYFTPEGYRVMTEAAHAKRGYCCGNQCRHCPYEYANVETHPEPAPPLIVRRAVLSDVPALVPLARQTFAAAYIGYQNDPAAGFVQYLDKAFTPAVFAQALEDETQQWWTAIDTEGRHWGYAVLVAASPHAYGSHQLKRLYVRRQARGHGVGRQLLAAVEAYAKTCNADAIWLETYVGAPALKTFYVPAGYVRIGTDYWTLGGQRFEVAVMSKG